MKTKAMHTPGSWKHEDGTPATEAELQDIWEFQNILPDAPDKKLLAAAPELLKVLKICLFYFEGESKAGRYIDVPAGFDHDISMEGLISKAIARAEGR